MMNAKYVKPYSDRARQLASALATVLHASDEAKMTKRLATAMHHCVLAEADGAVLALIADLRVYGEQATKATGSAGVIATALQVALDRVESMVKRNVPS